VAEWVNPFPDTFINTPYSSFMLFSSQERENLLHNIRTVMIMAGNSYGFDGSDIARHQKETKDYLIDEKNACVRCFKRSFTHIKIIER